MNKLAAVPLFFVLAACAASRHGSTPSEDAARDRLVQEALLDLWTPDTDIERRGYERAASIIDPRLGEAMLAKLYVHGGGSDDFMREIADGLTHQGYQVTVRMDRCLVIPPGKARVLTVYLQGERWIREQEHEGRVRMILSALWTPDKDVEREAIEESKQVRDERLAEALEAKLRISVDLWDPAFTAHWYPHEVADALRAQGVEVEIWSKGYILRPPVGRPMFIPLHPGNGSLEDHGGPLEMIDCE